MSKLGTLHLIPVGLSNSPVDEWLPRQAQAVAASTPYYIAENAKTARTFLKLFSLTRPLQEIDIQTLSGKTDDQTLLRWLEPLKAGHDVGLVSEAGCPAVADPGSRIVGLAHQMGITVRPWVGPSSIMLGLMGSGLDGQRFAFHGYAPIKPDDRARQLKHWEQLSKKMSQTQILIETPYRNPVMFDTLLQTLQSTTRLCIAKDLTGTHEWLRTMRIRDWKQTVKPDLKDSPTLFLFQA